MDRKVEINDEEVPTWVAQQKKNVIAMFFKNFNDIYDTHLTEIVQCTKIEEYIELEDKLIGPSNIIKPGKIPIRLNKPETKVPAVYYFLTVFLMKWAGQAMMNIIEEVLESHEKIRIENERIRDEKETTAAELEPLKWENEELLAKLNELKNNSANSSLTNGLIITDLEGRIKNLEVDVTAKENKIRNLEADVTAKERIILEKSEQTNMLWEKIKGLEAKVETPTCQKTDMDLDKMQTKKKRSHKKRKRARAQQNRNGMIGEIEIGPIDDSKKDDLEKYFAERSRDITFYDIPAYWSDDEIFNLINANMGHIEYMRTKRCYKYKTVKVTLRLTKNYEKIYNKGGVNVCLTRKNRTHYIRMFDSRWSYAEIKNRFRWQACKRLEDDNQQDDSMIIRYFSKTYQAVFGKIIRVNGIRYIILYFSTEDKLMKALTDSIKIYDVGLALLIKKENDFIDDTGNIHECVRRTGYRTNTSSASGVAMGQKQRYRDFGPR
ncbi:hypothetical protein RhiirA4_530505 [Rhizophagus irregularis]|uniref:Uncharacterized protein n=1 Tax=Rhizophagus irregularis TaxID=588596 RepID=A0A2I1GV24_9GLOM|nr:hypothetical protein RhiirA4_530505 [Rhizophagus irregularis]